MSEHAIEIQFPLHPKPRTTPPAGEREPIDAGDGSLPRVTQALALALDYQGRVERGEVRDYAELARQNGVTRERMSQLMKLVWLAPNIQREILYLPPTPSGRYPISELALRRIACRLSWEEQRNAWQTLGSTAKL